MRANDLTGESFGDLVAIRYHPNPGALGKWECLCTCGNTTYVLAKHLGRRSQTSSCGCARKRRALNLTGQRFGRLIPISRAKNAGSGASSKARWLCKCDCGETSEVFASALTAGLTKSCGCIRREFAQTIADQRRGQWRHGQSGSRTHRIWCGMTQRCNDPNHRSYPDYGGRGIAVCERWRSFENFLSDMGEAPDTLTLERNEVNLGYSPDNCRWASWEEQANNRRNTFHIEAFGQRKTLSQWSRQTGLTKSSLVYRLARGMRPEEALSMPPRDLPRSREFRPAGHSEQASMILGDLPLP